MPACVGGKRHRAAERVDLLDQVALADAADGRIAAHLPQRLDVVREQQGAPAHARSRERGFGARMAAADHDHVEFRTETHHAESTRFSEARTVNRPPQTPGTPWRSLSCAD